MSAEIEIELNGEKTRVPAALNVAALLQHLALDAGRVAIEVDRQLVRRPDWESRHIHAGAQVEIVHFVGGGLTRPAHAT